METLKIVNATKAFIKLKLEGEGSGHDYWHVMRVYHNALDIASTEENVDIFIVELGALLHDIADHKFGYSDEDRRRMISEHLKSFDVEQRIIEHVVEIANTISFKGGKNTTVMSSIEGLIVQDADRLDAIGAIGIARAFAYGGYADRPMYSPFEGGTGSSLQAGDTISHFYEKLLLLKDRMNTSTGKKKAEMRHSRMESFLDMFYEEWGIEDDKQVAKNRSSDI